MAKPVSSILKDSSKNGGQDLSANGRSASIGTNGNSASARSRIEEIAAHKDNPDLWLAKYQFYITELHLSEAEAERWADHAVLVNTEAQREFDLATR
ncbi:MAG: hypothetical protein ABI923_09375 [bacterium]